MVAAHAEFSYAELRTATRAVLAGAEMISGGRDRAFPVEGGAAPGTGAVVAALEYATGETARNVGKPDPQVFKVALDRLGGGRTLVVGDHLESDLGGATAARARRSDRAVRGYRARRRSGSERPDPGRDRR